MAQDVLRVSQVVGVFGPGAMVDLPERSVIVAGLDDWNMRGPAAFKPINEPRLAEYLRERLTLDRRWPENRALALRTPPLGSNDLRQASPSMQVRVFPSWFTAEAPTLTDPRRRRMVRWSELDPTRRRDWIDEGGRRPVTPIRFVCGCQNGHLQDIDWKWVIHNGATCQEPMWIEDIGTSAEPRDTRVRCGCSKFISLDELFIKGRLGKCMGERPWIGDREAGCTDSLRLLTRSATNTYFPQVASVISLPIAEDELTKHVSEIQHLIGGVTEASQIETLRLVPQVASTLKGYSNTDVFERLKQLREATTVAAAKDPRVAEFELLASGKKVIGEATAESRLHAETLDRDVWDPHRNPICSGIASLVAVHRLREVSCLYGFTRFEPAPMADDGLEDIGLAIRGAWLGVHNDWLPAIEQFGEGLFIHLNSDSLAAWLARSETVKRLTGLRRGAENWMRETGQRLAGRGSGPYMLAHGISHALMTEISLDCGYPASALRERIYAMPPVAGSDKVQCGVLIYTATAGTQGTLGGIVEVASRFFSVLETALEHLHICSGDPICADHDPSTRSDDRALHGAACHGCLLVAETSCEARNLHLDRALLVNTMACIGAGFFGQ